MGKKSLRLQAFFLENANGGRGGAWRRRVVREKGVLVKIWGGAQLISLKLSSQLREFLVAKLLCKDKANEG